MNSPAAPPVQEDLIVRASLLPEQFFTATATASQSGGRDNALVLTREDVLNIKRYEYAALRLPRDPASLALLGLVEIDVAGLTCPDLLLVYEQIIAHATTWAPIEEDVMLVGSALNQFADAFTLIGNNVLDVIAQMRLADRVTTALGELQVTELKGLDALALSPENLQVKTSVTALIALIGTRISAASQQVEGVRGRIRGFSMAITQVLLPLVASKLQIAREQGLEEKLRLLDTEMASLRQRIEELRRSYKKTCANAAWGLFGGPIGLAIAGGILGTEAEKIRKQKNLLIAELDEKTAEVARQRSLLGVLNALDNLMQDIEFRLFDAEQSAINLRELWNLLGTYVDGSLTRLTVIEDDISLLVFAVEFRDVMRPWADIGNLTRQLHQTFESALKESRLGANA